MMGEGDYRRSRHSQARSGLALTLVIIAVVAYVGFKWSVRARKGMRTYRIMSAVCSALREECGRSDRGVSELFPDTSGKERDLSSGDYDRVIEKLADLGHEVNPVEEYTSDEALVDSWGNRLVIRYAKSEGRVSSCVVISKGVDGRLDTKDDGRCGGL